MKLDKYLLLAVVSLMISCGTKEPQQPEATPASEDIVRLSEKQYSAASIAVGKVERQKIANQIRVNGIIDVPPQNLVIISPPIGGFVKYTMMKEGMHVKKGELLVTLENIEFIQLQQDYLENKSKLQFLEEEFRRQEDLAKENINSGKSVQLARSNYEATNASVKALEAKLSLINITPAMLAKGEIKSQINLYSPIEGFVSEVNVNLGEFMNSTDPMFKIVNLDHMHILLHVYEKDLMYIKENQEVKFKVGNDQADRLASIYLIGKEITPERTIHVHCHLKQDKQDLIPGMYVTASIQVQEKESDVLPNSAIVTYLDDQVIFASTGKPREFRMIKVQAGESGNNMTEVSFKEVLPLGTEVVVSGANHLLGILKNGGEEE